jgi:hypothetical protein
MHKPNRSFAKKVFAAGLAVSTALWAFGGFVYVAQATEAHPGGTLVLSSGTVYQLNADGTGRYGINSLEKFNSSRFSFAKVVPANSADLALPDLGLLAWGSGVLFNDGGTVYQVAGGTKHGFTSAANFTGNGFSFAKVKTGSLTSVPAGANIDNTTGAHLEGTFVVSGGTVYMITATGRKGIPEPGVLYSYGVNFSDVVAANAADLALASEGNATYRAGTIVNDSGTIYAAVGTQKRGFPTASCYTGFGFTFGMTVTGSTSSLTVGTNYCATEEGGGGGVGGTLSVSLASDTPASGIAVKSGARVPFTKVALTASGGDVTVDSWVMLRSGVAADSSFSSVDIVDLSNNSTINDSGKTFSTDHTAAFTEDLLVKSGETKYVMLAGNMAASPGSGEQPTLTLQSLTVKSGTLVGSFPIVGNAMTINTSIVIGTSAVSRGAYSNATSTALEVGKTAYTFLSFQIQGGAAEDITFKQVKVYESGSASLSSDLTNIKLYKDGTFLANGVVSGNYVNFSFTSETITKGQTVQYLVKADIVSGSARTVKFAIWRNTDIYVVGTTYNTGITSTFSGTGSGGTASPVLTDNQATISTGTLRVGRSSTVAATNVAVGNSQVLGAFEFEAKGEPVIVTALTLTVSSSSASQIEDALQAVKLVDSTGKTLAGPTDVTNNALTVAFTDTFTVPVGLNHFKVVGNLATNGGWANNNTITVSINTPASAITAKGEVTGQSVTPSPSANTAASQQTVKAAKLVVTKNSTPTSKTVVVNSTGVLAGSWQLDATDSGENIRITTVAVRASTTGKFNTLTLKWGGAALSPVNNNPVSSNDANNTSTFALSDPIIVNKGTSANLDLYVNIASNANAGEADAWGLTDTVSATNASVVAYGVTTGNRAAVTLTANNGALLTVGASGTLTINIDGSNPSSRLAVFGTTGVTLSEVRIKATNEDVDITQMTLVVADGGLVGTATGSYAQLSKVYFKLDGAVIGNLSGYVPAAATTTISLERGAMTIPAGTTGKKLSILGDLVNVGTNEPGVANADILVGLYGGNAFTATGNQSNTALAIAYKTYTDSTGSAIILHRAVPSVVIVAPSNKLGATAILHEVKISAVGNTIGLYRLTYSVTSSTSVIATNYYTKLASCTGCGGVADGNQLSTVDAAGDYLINGEDITIHTMATAQLGSSRYHLQIAAGATATIDLYATVSLTTGTDTVSTRVLGDTASSTLTDDGGCSTSGYGCNASAFTALTQGNFVWSDLYSSDANTATGTTGTKQWYNGYYVTGLGSTTTTTPVTIGE